MTHKETLGVSDQQMLEISINGHANRYGEAFWAFFDAHVAPRLPERPFIADLGCGPGLLLRDLGARYPQATLYGCDVVPLMVEHARGVEHAGLTPQLEVVDLEDESLPLPDRSVDLAAMGAVLHILDDALGFLADLRRVMAPGGVYLLSDMVRVPLREYLKRSPPTGDADPKTARQITNRYFARHNKYTDDDYRYLMEASGFEVVASAILSPRTTAYAAVPA